MGKWWIFLTVVGVLALLWNQKHPSLSVLPGLPRNDPSYPRAYRQVSQIADLPDGRVHFAIHSPREETKGRIVIVHGFSLPGPYYLAWIDAFVQEGFEVLSYDLWGRGMSEYPLHIDLNAKAFASQLVQLLAHLGWLQEKPPIVVGGSMGGAIAVSYASHFPKGLSALGLVAPAGLLQDVKSEDAVVSKIFWARLFAKPPFRSAASLISRFLVPHVLRDGMVSDWGPLWQETFEGGLLEAQLNRSQGFVPATVSIVLNMELDEAAPVFAKVGAHSREVCVVWGEEDATVPFHTSKRLATLMPQAVVHPLKDCGHNFADPQCDFVSPLIDLAKRTFQTE